MEPRSKLAEEQHFRTINCASLCHFSTCRQPPALSFWHLILQQAWQASGHLARIPSVLSKLSAGDKSQVIFGILLPPSESRMFQVSKLVQLVRDGERGDGWMTRRIPFEPQFNNVGTVLATECLAAAGC